MLGDEAIEPRGEPFVGAGFELSLDPLLDRLEPEFVEPLAFAAEGVELEQIGERPSAPERERLAELQRRVVRGERASEPHRAGEALEIELLRRDAGPVAGARTLDPIGAHHLADSVHGDLERVRDRRRRIVAPDDIHEPVARDDRVSRSAGVRRGARADGVVHRAPAAHRPS